MLILEASCYILLVVRGIAQSGSASGLGPEGREFESLCPDHLLIWLFLEICNSLRGYFILHHSSFIAFHAIHIALLKNEWVNSTILPKISKILRISESDNFLEHSLMTSNRHLSSHFFRLSKKWYQ